MSGDEILLFTHLKLRKFNLSHGSVMHCHACYNFVIQQTTAYPVTTWENRDISVTVTSQKSHTC